MIQFLHAFAEKEGIDPEELEYIYDKTRLDKQFKINQVTATQISKLFRYPSDNNEQRPAFKATGGKLNQFIESGFTVENGRSEWGYSKTSQTLYLLKLIGIA